jgi:hypothetical protein
MIFVYIFLNYCIIKIIFIISGRASGGRQSSQPPAVPLRTWMTIRKDYYFRNSYGKQKERGPLIC